VADLDVSQRHQRDRPEQRKAGPVQSERGKFPYDHAQVDQPEDDEHARGHGPLEPPGAALPDPGSVVP